MSGLTNNRSLIVAGVTLGLGFCGFFDGIVFHQILQWHHMLTSAGYPATTIAGLEANTLADGLFHGATYLITALGLLMLWRTVQRSDVPWSGRIFGGALLIGAGAFNLVEGLVNHHLLSLHHVKEGPGQLAWDLAFLAGGAILALAGVMLLQTGQRAHGRTSGK